MAVRKRKRRRARRKAHNPKRKAFRRKKRRHISNPKKRVKRRRVRRAHANPRRKRRHVRRAHARRRHANPARRRRSGKRRHRRNPGLPLWAMTLLASGVAVASYAVVHVAATGVTQHMDPTFGTLGRNRNIAAGAALIGGIALAVTKSPVIGAALAAGGAVALLGTPATLKLTNILPAPAAATPTAAKMSAVYADTMAAVYADNMAAVYAQNMQGIGGYLPMQGYESIGDFATSPPWQSSGPF